MAFGAAIGFMLGMMICGSAKLTGCAANPMRALGPNVLSGDFYPLLVYFTAPFAGAILAAAVFYYFIDTDRSMKNIVVEGAQKKADNIGKEFENLDN